MPCPHNNRELDACSGCTGLFCGEDCLQVCVCGASLCVDCWNAHSCPTAMSDVGELRDMEEEASDPNDIEVMRPLDGSETISDAFMASEVQRAESREEMAVEGMPDVPLSETFASERIVIPNDTITIALPKPSPKRYPFTCLLWNVANLGGKFGYPQVRDQSVIDATALIIHTAAPDVAAILEVLHHGAPDRRPKPPVTPRGRLARGGLLAAFHDAFGVGVGHVKHFDPPDPRREAKRELLNSIVSQWFAARFQSAMWPDANVDMTPFEDAAKELKLAGRLLDVVMDEAWGALNGKAAKKRKRDDEDFLKPMMPELMARLVEEGYTHFLDDYEANYAKDTDDEEGLSPEEKKDRDRGCKEAIAKLHDAASKAWVKFLQILIGRNDLPGEHDCWSTLVMSNQKARTADYERRLEKYEETQKKRKSGSRHDGISEFLRIRAALNVLAGDAYDSWPAEEPGPEEKSIYTHGETYGILWKKTVFDMDAAKCQYVSAVAEGVKFDKREPLRVVLQLRKRPDAPPVHLVAWHPPAPSTGNQVARSKDFPAFIQYCKQERAAQRLGMLLSDLNVNTVTEKTDIEQCSTTISMETLFNGICGTRFALKAFDDQLDAHSTVVVSKLRPWLLDDILKEQPNEMVDEDDKREEIKKRLVALRKLDPTRRIFDNIESFLSHPQLRYGCSAYDKILTICTGSGSWALRHKSTYVVPVPHAVALKEEKGLLRHVDALNSAIRPFAFLLQDKAGEGLAILRKYAEKPGPVKTLRELMTVARKLSDHMPLVANFDLVDGDGSGGEEMVEETTTEPAGETSSLERLEELARNYETAPAGEAREAALAILLVGFNETWPPEDVPARAVSRLQRAMQSVEISDRRELKEDSDERQESRPESKGGAKHKPAVQLAARLTEDQAQIRTNAGGGDCLFRSLSQLIFGNEASHAAVRIAVVNHLEDLLAGHSLDAGGTIGPTTAAEFGEFMRQLLLWHRAQWPHAAAYRRVHGLDPWRQYAIAMSRGEWGDLIALSAASHLFGMRIRVYVRCVAAFWTDEVNFVDVHRDGRPEVILLNSGNYHFEAITPVARVTLDDPAIGQPAEWDAITVARDRAAAVGPAARPSAMDTSGTTKSPSTSEPAKMKTKPGTKPALDSAVCLWPHDVYWSRPADAKPNPRALFLFGENGHDHHSTFDQLTTQACIRGEPNAVGIRTCWDRGANGSGAMVDSALPKNTKAIDDDVREAKEMLLTGLFTTLVVPWVVSSGKTALGTGVANLPGGAPNTYDYLCVQIDELIKWAEANLRNVLVATRETDLALDICKRYPSSLFVHETTKAFRDTVKLSIVPHLLHGANVFGVCTGSNPFALKAFGDTDLAASTGQIDADFDPIEDAVKSGKFRRVVLPDGTKALGVENKLATHSPATDAHLQKRIAQLIKLCATIDSSALLMPELVTSLPSAFTGGGEESDEEVRPSKKSKIETR